MIMKLAKALSLLLIMVLAASSQAATHTITFENFSYSPSSLPVNVGDVIVWQGDFSMHPLQSDPGAPASFSNSSGGTFSFTVPSAGTYDYHCTAHGSPGGGGMSGSFTATDAGVDDHSTAEALLQLQAYPNPASASLTLSYTLEKSSDVRVRLFDMNGRQLDHVENSGAPGQNTTYMNVATLPIGSYYYRIETSDAILTRKFTVSR